VLLVFALLFAGQVMVAAGRYVFGEEAFELPKLGVTWNSTLFLGLLVLVFTIAWSGSGRTIGNNVVGLRVVRDNGGPVSWPRALARALVVVALTILSMGWILVSRKNAGLHDLVCRTAVVYDWRARRAHDDRPSAAARSAAPARTETRPIR